MTPSTQPLARALRAARGSAAASALHAASDRLDVTARAGRFTREVSLTLAAVLLVGVGAASANPVEAPSVQLAAPAAAPAAPEPRRPAVPFRPTTTEALAAHVPNLSVPEAPKPKPKRPAAAPAVAPPPHVDRWLPTGTGMWLHDWKRSQGGNAKDVIARSKRSGFTHLYVQTGSTKKGWIGEEVLSELLPATRHTGIKVIAWDFPKLIDPEADARRMVKAATWRRPNTATVAAVAPDIETAAEGTRISSENVTRYYRELRRLLPKHVPILATVPWPSEKRTGSYPYAATAPWSDAIIPMAYWYNRDPAVVTATSMTWLKRFGKPVIPVGQGYDGRIDAPYLSKDPDLAGSVTSFIDTARKHGALSVSLWSWQTTEGAPWTSLAKASGTIGPKPPTQESPPVVVPTPAAPGAGAKAETPKERAERKAKDKAPGRKHDRAPARERPKP